MLQSFPAFWSGHFGSLFGALGLELDTFAGLLALTSTPPSESMGLRHANLEFTEFRSVLAVPRPLRIHRSIISTPHRTSKSASQQLSYSVLSVVHSVLQTEKMSKPVGNESVGLPCKYSHVVTSGTLPNECLSCFLHSDQINEYGVCEWKKASSTIA